MFELSELRLKGAFVIESYCFEDSRGSFNKFYVDKDYNNIGVGFRVSEAFVSISNKNVIRGMHFQLRKPQAKLIRVISGKVQDVLVDLRKESATYGKWEKVELSGANHRTLYIPAGFAHGFLSCEDNTAMLYQCEGDYDKETDTGIVFDDPVIGVDWDIDLKEAIVSDKDRSLMSFYEYERNHIRLE